MLKRTCCEILRNNCKIITREDFLNNNESKRIEDKLRYLDGKQKNFGSFKFEISDNPDIKSGWLSNFVVLKIILIINVSRLKYKKKTAIVASKKIKEANSDKLFWLKQAKELEFYLEELKEIFSVENDYFELINEERNEFFNPEKMEIDEDQAHKFLTQEECIKFPVDTKYQITLERYKNYRF